MKAFLGHLDLHIVYVLGIMLVTVLPAFGWFGIWALVIGPQGMILTRAVNLRKRRQPAKDYVAANEATVACMAVVGAGLCSAFG